MTKVMKASKGRKKPFIRGIVQAFFLLVVLVTINVEYLAEKGVTIPFLNGASIHAICPFGGVVSIYQFLTEGTFVQKIHQASFVLMFLVIVLAIAFGAAFCGWICPFGTVQEWVSKLGRKIFKKKFNTFIPAKLDKYLRFTRYILLGLVIFNTARTGLLMFQNIDPYYALFNFFSGEVAVMAYAILAITMILSLFIERPWCKYACPYGALLGLFNLFRVFGIKRNVNTCINCKACDRACPMNIEVSAKATVRNHQCISCMECTSENACPIKNTVELKVGGYKDEN